MTCNECGRELSNKAYKLMIGLNKELYFCSRGELYSFLTKEKITFNKIDFTESK